AAGSKTPHHEIREPVLPADERRADLHPPVREALIGEDVLTEDDTRSRRAHPHAVSVHTTNRLTHLFVIASLELQALRHHTPRGIHTHVDEWSHSPPFRRSWPSGVRLAIRRQMLSC